MNLVVCSYLVVLILAILAMCRLLYITKNQRAPYFVGLFMQLIVVAGSYVVVSTARTAEEALLATKFTYLDGTFVILFLMLGMCQICNIRLPKWLLVPMIIVDFEVMTVVFMAGHNTLHYESYSTRKDLIKENDKTIPLLLDYNIQSKNDSMHNTPNTFAIYVLGLVCKWIESKGGVKALEEINTNKSK